MAVFDNVVGRVEIQYLQQAVLNEISDWPKPNNNL